MQIKIKGTLTIAELLVSLQVAVDELQQRSRGEAVTVKYVSVFLTATNEKGETVPMFDPATGRRMKDDKDNKAVVEILAYKGPTTD
ncbi:hypothetical protein GHK68_00045 [Sinorhizobium meliloti]|uniref:hypothetical protein n=1 Tax=Rhizobium meliloti TaxID=382 RepID=UPI00129746B8|nr:hypothetical protein [Sinorhizobium meliloti]MQW40778.1 hypothetical protein [Sinorhizobium meliloti]